MVYQRCTKCDRWAITDAGGMQATGKQLRTTHRIRTVDLEIDGTLWNEIDETSMELYELEISNRFKSIL